MALVLLALVGGCSRKPDESKPGKPGDLETLVLRYEGTAGNVAYAELAEELGYLAPIKLEYVGNNSTGGPHSIQAVVTGDTDIGSSFNGAIIKLIAAKAPLKAVVASYGTDVETFNGFYVLEDSPIKSARDLVGKHVAMNTLGAHSEFALKEYLARAGLTAEQAKQVSMIQLPSINIELSLREKQVEVASLGQIFRPKALERGGIRPLFTDYDMFGAFNAGSYVMSNRFIAQNPNTVRKFVDAVGRAIDWARAQPREVVVARMRDLVKKRGRGETDEAVRYWRSPGVATPHGTLTDADYQVWIDWLVKDGQLPKGRVTPDDIYTNSFQPSSVASR